MAGPWIVGRHHTAKRLAWKIGKTSPSCRLGGQYNARAAQGTMLKRPGRAEGIAAAILFLASGDASCVTGALLFVDRG